MKRVLLVIAALLGFAALQAFGMKPSPLALMGVALLGELDVEQLQEILKKNLGAHRDQQQQVLDQAINEVKTLGTVVAKTSDQLTEIMTKSAETQARLMDVEQKLAKRATMGEQAEYKSIGQRVVESDQFKSTLSRGDNKMDAVDIGSFHKTALTNATGSGESLIRPDRIPGVVIPAERVLTVRNLLPVGTTGSNMVEYVKENVYTNNAAPQYSSPNRENVAKAESGLTYTLANAPVVTLAHFLPASRQILSDSPQLASIINSRLMYGLKLEEEDEILNGDGTGGALNGLRNQATAYNRGTSGDQALDTLLKAFLQVTLSEYVADGVVLNHIDWTDILLLKDTQGRYLFGHPGMSMGNGMSMDMTMGGDGMVMTPQVWGRPVVATNSMPEGNFLTGAFAMAAQLWDREQSTIRIAEQHSDFFVKNMVAILAEERLALTVYRAAALVKGTI